MERIVYTVAAAKHTTSTATTAERCGKGTYTVFLHCLEFVALGTCYFEAHPEFQYIVGLHVGNPKSR